MVASECNHVRYAGCLRISCKKSALVWETVVAGCVVDFGCCICLSRLYLFLYLDRRGGFDNLRSFRFGSAFCMLCFFVVACERFVEFILGVVAPSWWRCL